MKAQYVGDIGDFGKLLLLKHLAACGFKIGVNWVLTPNVNRSDGKHRDYINYGSKDCLCCCDPEIYTAILPLANEKDKDRRAIADLEARIRRFAPDAVFFDEVFNSGDRTELDMKARGMLIPKVCDLVFFDPDNGIGGEQGSSSKHVYYSELCKYWKRGQSILVYHHLNRSMKHGAQIGKLKTGIRERFNGASVYATRLCRGSARAYFLCIQPKYACSSYGLGTLKAIAQSIRPLRMTKTDWSRISRRCAKHI